MRSVSGTRRLLRWIGNGLLVVLLVWTLVPFYWMVAAAPAAGAAAGRAPGRRRASAAGRPRPRRPADVAAAARRRPFPLVNACVERAPARPTSREPRAATPEHQRPHAVPRRGRLLPG